MELPAGITYQVDRDNRLTGFGAGWRELAHGNGAPELDAHAIHGRPLAEFISDIDTAAVYDALLRRVRTSGRTVRFLLRCDRPDLRRVLSMEMTGLADEAVRFQVQTVIEKRRPPIRLLEVKRRRAAEIITMCSWCQRIQTPTSGWLQVEEAVQGLGLFGRLALPTISHGMCAECRDTMQRMSGTPAMECSQPGER